MKKLLCFLTIISFAAATVLSGCSIADSKYSKQYIGAFDTVTVIAGYAKNKKAFDVNADILFDKLLEYHRLFDIYNEYDGINNLKVLNVNAGKFSVQVDSEIISLIEFAKHMYGITEGNVNIAMGSVLKIWHEYRQNGVDFPEDAVLPPQEILAEASRHTDINCIVINKEESTVYINDPKASVDVGAVAKGYAVQRVCEYAKSVGMCNMIINVGGNVRTIGEKDGEDWSVGIALPEDSENSMLCTVKVRDAAVVTSGAYRRYYKVNGKNFHHIIDPKTLMPSDAYVSVSVVSADSAVADALSTALFNMNPIDGKRLIESIENTEALWVFADGSRLYSDGFRNMIDREY